MATGAAMALLLCAVFALHTLTEAQQGNYDACKTVYGHCLLVEDCPPGKLTNTKGLCPRQGYECCLLQSLEVRRCNDKGGACMPETHCKTFVWDEDGDDCASGNVCCVKFK